MIELYFAPTPNGWKISIMLEECGLPYHVNWVDIGQGEQFSDTFHTISPNNKIPAITDMAPAEGGEPISVFESGAILIYLADKAGKFIPPTMRERVPVLEWLMWQVSGLGPMLGQHGHFKLYAPERIAYATERYRREALRLYRVLDTRLAGVPFVGGGDYGIADMATFPWVQTYRAQQIDLDAFPFVKAWYDALKERPALRRGMALGRDLPGREPQDEAKTRKLLFGIDDKQ